MYFTNPFSKVIDRNFLNHCEVVSLKMYITIITELEHEYRILGSKCSSHFVVIWLLRRVWLFVTPRTAACQASLSFIVPLSLLKCKSIESVMWSHPTISSFVVPFSSCPQSFPASGSSPMSWLSASGGQSIGVSASASVLPMNPQHRFPLGWTGWISLQSKGLSRVFSNTTVQKQFFGAQLFL